MNELVDTVPFKVSCHRQPMEYVNQGSFESDKGKEVKVVLRCVQCGQTWVVHTTMSKLGNPTAAKRQGAYRAARSTNRLR